MIKTNKISRRDFIKTTSTVSMAGYAGFPLIKGLKKKYRVVLIGSGWWGTNILREAHRSERVKITGICDVDQRALKKATTEIASWGIKSLPKWYTDYRECIEKAKPDIAIVATPDHWHALPAIEAIKSGAHVYIEKPIGHTVLEGKAILNTARRYQRKVQVGTHRRVSPHNTSAIEFLKSGKAGKISNVKCFVNYNSPPRDPVPDENPPEGLDWDAWIGPAPYRNYNPRIHPKGFRQFLDFANGQIGDWGIHWFDQVLWWTDEKFPSSIYSTGGRFINRDNTDAPDTQLATFAFENFTLTWEHKLKARNENEDHHVGCYFYGTKGTMHIGWMDGWTFYPADKKMEKIHVEPQLRLPDHQNIQELWTDFMEAIDHDHLPFCDIEKGYLATNLSLLAMISYKLGRSVTWDGKGISNDQEASILLSRPYRKPWEYPEV